MKAVAWVDSHSSGVPVQLAANIKHALADGEAAPDIFLGCGLEMLEDLLKSGATDRSAALDLLTVDALVTYAFDIDVVDMEPLARTSMRKLAGATS